MHLHRRAKIQLAIFAVIALVALSFMSLQFMKLPAKMFGVGRYTVTVELPEAAGLYGSSNVTYRGVEVGRVESVHLTATGVAAVLSLKAGIDIPSDLEAEVHSQSAIGEQYVLLLPRNGNFAAPEERRRDSARRHPRAAQHQHHSGPGGHRSEGGPQGQPQDRHRRVVHGRGRARSRTEPNRQRLNRPVDRGAQESRPADRADRQIEAGAGFAVQHIGRDSGVGGAPGDGDQ